MGDFSMTNEEVIAKMAELQKRIDAFEQAERDKKVMEANSAVAKNKRPGKPDQNTSYILKLDRLPMDGLVPQQQLDIAAILIKNMEVGKKYTEAEVFGFLVDGAGDYKSLYTSKQDVTYLFRYYRGLGNKDGKHAGYIKRGFLQEL